MKQAVIAFVMGSLITGGGLGAFGYMKVSELDKDNQILNKSLAKEQWRNKNLTKLNSNLGEENKHLKAKKIQNYDNTYRELLSAKENANLESLYRLGLEAFRQKDFPRAYYAFEQVNKSNKEYKDIATFLSKARVEFEKYNKNKVAKRLESTYLSAMDHQAKNNFGQAQNLYQQVLSMDANYKDTKERLKKTKFQFDLVKQKLKMDKTDKMIEESYKMAFDHQGHGRLKKAQLAYQFVVKYQPKYKDAKKRLDTVTKQLGDEAANQPPPAPNTVPNSVTSANNALLKQFPNAQPAASINCYQLGVTYGKCTQQAMNGKPCANMTQLQVPKDCKGDADFQKGLKSAMNQGMNSMMRGMKF